MPLAPKLQPFTPEQIRALRARGDSVHEIIGRATLRSGVTEADVRRILSGAATKGKTE